MKDAGNHVWLPGEQLGGWESELSNVPKSGDREAVVKRGRDGRWRLRAKNFADAREPRPRGLDPIPCRSKRTDVQAEVRSRGSNRKVPPGGDVRGEPGPEASGGAGVIGDQRHERAFWDLQVEVGEKLAEAKDP